MRIVNGVRLASFGLVPMVLGHLVAFVLAVPDPHARHELLDSTGHGAFHVVVSFALVVGFLAVSHFVSQGFRSVRRGSSWSLPSVFHLICFQAGLYLALEVTERALSGGVMGLIGEPTLLMGLAAQIPTAFLAILKLRALRLVVTRLAGAHRRSRRRVASLRPPSLFMERGRLYHPICRRGPPASLSI